MDIKQLLEKMEEFAGEKVGQKSGDQWRGTDKDTPGKKLVGDSIIKDLSKGPTPKTKEQELAEEWATFSEENIGTHPKRPRRTSDRHARGHEPQARYKTVKADEQTIKGPHGYLDVEKNNGVTTVKRKAWDSSGSRDTDVPGGKYYPNPGRRNDGTGVGVASRDGISSTQGSRRKLPRIEPDYTERERDLDESSMSEKDIELQDYRSMSHKEFQAAYGMTKTEWINKNKALVIQNPKLKQALGLEEGEETAPAALADPIVATVVKQMRPGLTGLDMGNEAFLYFAYELGKQRARDSWSDYLPAIRHAYEQGLNEDANTDNKLAKLLTRFVNQSEGADRAVAADAIEYIRKLGHIEQFATSLDYFAVDLDEGSKEDGPVEARWMVKVSDDEGDHLKTYHRKFPSLSDAKKAYKNTPYATDFKHKPVKKDQVEEAIDSDIVQAMGQDSFNRAGYNPLRDERDYLDTLSKLSNLARKPGLDQAMKDHITQRILDLNAEARKKGFTQVESRGHKILATKLKDVERAKKFASGELKIPTPQERQAQLTKQEPKKEKVDEYGADNPAQATTQKASPAQAQQAAANLNTQKTALGQLKQLNPDINPQKAAMAATKDLATMNPQEKEELAQVAKTLTPALGSPAFGSIKTALQKVKNN